MPRSILIIAGTDSSGGAGLLRDAAVARDLGLGTRCAVTAVTAQTNRAVAASAAMPANLVTSQLAGALSGPSPDAVKIGMLGNAGIVRAVADALTGYPGPVVLDPVLASSSGRVLLTPGGIDAMRETLLPLCTLVTPNLTEAGALTGSRALRQQADRLRDLGAAAVLIKGGHGQGADSTDYLYDKAGQLPLSAPRLARGKRGTGCTLAAAIAGYLALGHTLRDACRAGKSYTHKWMAESGVSPSA